jgi:hypothetical protein
MNIDLGSADTGPSDHEAGEVRPYTMTGGRTRSVMGDLPMETLVEAIAAPAAGWTSEQRDILAIATGGYQSIAELSAYTRLPLGVVRVLVGDLEAAGLLYVHGLSTSGAPTTVTPLSVLESVLDGICAL